MSGSYGVINLWTYLAGTIFIVLLPGPNSMFVLATAAGRGVSAGYRAAAGVFLGDSVLMALTAAGAASVLRLVPMLFLALKAVGALYLCYLAVQLLRSAVRPATVHAHVHLASGGGDFHRALFLSLLNPKAILFFLSFFIQFVDPAYPHPALSFLLLAAILQACSFLYLSGLIWGGSRLATFFRRRLMLARIGSALVGLLFLWFAVLMIVDT